MTEDINQTTMTNGHEGHEWSIFTRYPLTYKYSINNIDFEAPDR